MFFTLAHQKRFKPPPRTALTALLPSDCPWPARLRLEICPRNQCPGGRIESKKPRLACFLVAELWATRRGSIRLRPLPVLLQRPTAARANEGSAQGGTPHGQVGSSLLAYSSVRKKGVADFLSPFNWLILSAFVSIGHDGGDFPVTAQTTHRHLRINNTGMNKRVTPGVIPTRSFFFFFSPTSDTFGEFHGVKLEIWVTSVSVSKRRSKADLGGLYLSLMLQVSNFSSL